MAENEYVPTLTLHPTATESAMQEAPAAPGAPAPAAQEAYDQISSIMPHSKSRIETVDATDLLRYEGGINCASWTVYDTPNRDLP